jgi:DUF1680 family protein
MNKTNKYCCFVISLFMGFNLHSQSKDSYYPISPVNFSQVELTDSFWGERIETNREVTIPIAFQRSEETGRIKNFAVAGGIEEGTFNSRRGFDDSDVFKVMEGAAFSLADNSDPVLDTYLDSLIYLVGAAQEEDGYIYTLRTILGDASSHRDLKGRTRWSGVETGSHELYNVGHMYEAAVAHYQATDKRNFLDLAIKNADLIDRTFGWGKLELVPGHQEIEIGLVKLYRATGDEKYLKLSKFFLDKRGDSKIDWTYNQTHKKVTEQGKAVGHSVRALYMYTAMADVAALTEDRAYVNAMDKLWHDIVETKFYITGGIGVAGGREGFGDHYELPNLRAYNETCAAISNVFWNYRLFLTHGDAKYIDVMERSMYNNVLSGVSLAGDEFFYPNPLESRGQTVRSEWFNVSCCPSNVSRYMPSVPGYIYAHTNSDIYVNLFLSSETTLELGDQKVKLEQVSQLPWAGNVNLKVDPENDTEFSVKIRIPGWASESPVPSDLYRFTKGPSKPTIIKINDVEYPYTLENGYAIVNRTWKEGDEISIDFPYEVRVIESNESIPTNRGRVALQLGPIVYCVEGHEVPNGDANHIYLYPNQSFDFTFEKDLLGGVNTISGKANLLVENEGSQRSFPFELKAVPYYGWANRGGSQMLVWIPKNEKFAVPKIQATIASQSEVTTSKKVGAGDLYIVNDLYKPKEGVSAEVTNFNWWPVKEGVENITYTFEGPVDVSESTVYWTKTSDGGVISPKSWKLYYKNDGEWKALKAKYVINQDGEPSTVKFKKVKAKSMKLEIVLDNKPAGLYEWEVQ